MFSLFSRPVALLGSLVFGKMQKKTLCDEYPDALHCQFEDLAHSGKEKSFHNRSLLWLSILDSIQAHKLLNLFKCWITKMFLLLVSL